jgi:hypothetical protein
LPSLAGVQLQQGLRLIPLDALEHETGLSRHTILRARQEKRIHPRSLQLLRIAARNIKTRFD